MALIENWFQSKFSLQTISGLMRKEREREREPSPQTELQFDDHSSALLRPSSTTTDQALVWRTRSHWFRRWQHRANQVKIDSNAARSCLCHTILPSYSPHNLASRSNLVTSLSSFFFQFDWIWWIFILGFVSFVFLYWEWYYIFVCQLRKCEQEVENVFFMIFSRTQPNTRKYFSKHFLKYNQALENIFFFLKIAFLENIYFLENILHEPNTAWDVSLFLKNHKR